MIFILLSSLANAVPMQFNHQGRLLDIDGVAVTGAHEMTFRIYDASTSGSVQWEETLDVQFEDGYYSVNLGQNEDENPLDTAVFINYPLWIELTVDGDTMEPRHPIQSVPYAQISEVSESVEGGTVDASEISIAGTTVINQQGSWVGNAVNWSELNDIPADLLDGDNDSQLSESVVEGYITNGSIDLAVGSTMDGESLLTAADQQWQASGTDTYFNGGNVGVGTQTPSSTLEVSGVIHSNTGGFKYPDGTTQTSAASGEGYKVIWSYRNGTSHGDFTTSFLWGDWIRDRLSEGTLVQGALYDCNMLSDNGAHYSGISFKISTNLNYGSYDNYHRVFDITNTDSAWVSGCSGSGFNGYAIYDVTAGVNNNGGFSYRNTCTQTITCRCIRLN